MQKNKDKITCSVSLFASDNEKLEHISKITKINRTALIRLILHNSLKNIDITDNVVDIAQIIDGVNTEKGD